jgi:LacI family transcriptional regulator
MSATIYDVASRARVSIATVSRALNAPHTVNGATLQRIQDAIEVLGFVPKAEATARARRNHRQIGVLAPFFTHYPSFMQRMRGIAAALQDTNYELVVYNADTPEHVRGYLHNLPTARRLDGLIVISLLLNDRSVNRLQEYELPTVMVEASHPMLSGIAIDNVAGGRLAAEYLLHKGHRRIGFVGGDRLLGGYAMGTSELRFTGFEAVLRDHNLTAVQADYAPKTSSHEEAYVQALELLRRAERPGAIFAANDTLALGGDSGRARMRFAHPGGCGADRLRRRRLLRVHRADHRGAVAGGIRADGSGDAPSDVGGARAFAAPGAAAAAGGRAGDGVG